MLGVLHVINPTESPLNLTDEFLVVPQVLRRREDQEKEDIGTVAEPYLYEPSTPRTSELGQTSDSVIGHN